MEIFIIDRFEGDYAVCEKPDKIFIDIPKNSLPENAKEGDCLVKEDSSYVIDYKLTEERKNRIQDKFKNLFS